MPPENSNRRLGRGLDALFSSAGTHTAQNSLRSIAISSISPNPYQPRKDFKPEDLKELTESLQVSGLLQPITVRPAAAGKGYELIAGERRLRAAANLGWKEIPAIVKELSDKDILALALVENLQRADLNPIEEADGYQQLIDQFGYTQQTVADIVGKDRSTIANVLRILQLPETVKELIRGGQLTSGQARPLLGLESSRIGAFAHQTVKEGWSAREVERRVREAAELAVGSRRGRPRKREERSSEVRDIEQRLRKHLQTGVSVTLKTGNKGTISIEFYSPEDLERVMELIGLESNQQ